MTEAQILVVEDERIVAKDIQNRLTNMGYQVPAVTATGEDAINKVEETRPDLVLMDIMLKGTMDGVTAAENIRKRFNVPVIYVTAYSDQNTLERAKISEPFGYLLKPFEERELHSTIEMALYKHKMEKKLKESEQWLSITLKSIGDAVIATDRNGLIAFMNPVAEQLTGWNRDEAMGEDLAEVFNVIDEKTRTHVESPVIKILRERVPYKLPYNTNLITRDGMEIPIDDSAAPIADDKGNIIGSVLAFRDITERKMAERVLRQHAQYLIKRVKELNCLYDVFNIAENPEGTLQEMIARCLKVMPAAWQYPEETRVRIRIGEEEYLSNDFHETAWKQSADILTDKECAGTVEVFYLREKPEKDEGPFLKEERSLINAIALQLGQFAERIRSTENLRHYAEELSEVVKEMNYAFILSDIIENPKATLNEIIEQTLDIIPEAMRFPERICARVVLDDREYKTENFEDTPVCYAAEIAASGRQVGQIEVGYIQAEELGETYAFLKEEKALVDSVALQLGRVTERKRDEAKWKETIASLERTRSELEKEGGRSPNELQESLRVAARNMGTLARIYKDEFRADSDEFTAYLANMTEYMNIMTDDLATYVQAEPLKKNFVETDCERALEKAIAGCRAEMDRTGTQFSHDPLPVVSANPLQIIQLFENLISNAIRLCGDQTPVIHVGAAKREGGWQFHVRDNGIGFPPEHTKSIYMIHQYLTERFDHLGVGIGLALCNRIVEHHGGKMWVESEPGKGATFYFTLPEQPEQG